MMNSVAVLATFLGVGAPQAELTWVFELRDDGFRVQEIWDFKSSTPVQIDAPLGSNSRALDPSSTGFELTKTGFASKGAPKGRALFGYTLSADGGQVAIRRRSGLHPARGRLIFQSIGGLSVVGISQKPRTSEFNGLEYIVYDMNPFPDQFDIVGVPSHSTLPRTLAVVLSLSAFVWMVAGLMSRGRTSQAAGPLGLASAKARKEQLLSALEILEEDRAAGTLKDKLYERRRKALVDELATVLLEDSLHEEART